MLVPVRNHSSRFTCHITSSASPLVVLAPGQTHTFTYPDNIAVTHVYTFFEGARPITTNTPFDGGYYVLNVESMTLLNTGGNGGSSWGVDVREYRPKKAPVI